MLPFLERFYSEVAKNLADPGTSRLYPKSERLADLISVQVQVWERLLPRRCHQLHPYSLLRQASVGHCQFPTALCTASQADLPSTCPLYFALAEVHTDAVSPDEHHQHRPAFALGGSVNPRGQRYTLPRANRYIYRHLDIKTIFYELVRGARDTGGSSWPSAQATAQKRSCRPSGRIGPRRGY